MAEANGDPPENGAAPVAFGFAKTAQKRKVAVNIEDKPKEKRQAITGFAGGSAVVADGAGEEEEGRQAPLVIPKLENTYKTGVGRKMVPSFRPPENDVASIAAGADRFEVAKLDTRPTVTGYGLERRARPQAEGETAANGQASTQPPPQQQGPRLTPQDLERQAYKQDVEALPNAPRTEVYESMPVEEFGMAMLRGMGWREGEGVGLRRQKAEPVEYLRRPERLGLGANPAALPGPAKPKQVKMGDKPQQAPETMVLPPTADGRRRHVRTLDEKLVPLSALGPRPGKTMRVVGGRHEGLACVILEMLKDDKGKESSARVRLLPSEEVVDIPLTHLQDPTQQTQQTQSTAAAGADRNGRATETSDRNGRSRDEGRGGSGRDERDREGRRERERDEERDRDRDRGYDRDKDRGRDRSRDRDRKGANRDRDDRDKDSDRSKKGDRGGYDRNRDRDDRDKDRGTRERDRGRGGYDDRKASHKSRGRSVSTSSGSEESSDGEGAGGKRVVAPQSVWLRPYTKVRVVDKHVNGGRLYLKKGTVVDVHPEGVCDVAVDDSRDKAVSLRQDQLETVIPKEVGAAVMIVSGSLRGNKGRLHAKSDAGACAVQLAHDFSIHRLLLDHVAMYVGSMDED